MEVNLSRMIRLLSPPKPYRDFLDRDLLRSLSHALRAQPQLWSPFYHTLHNRSGHESSQVRFLCFQLTHYFFCRSAHFRAQVCRSYLPAFLSCFTTGLPPPEQFAKRIQKILYHVICHWVERFGGVYPHLRILKREFRAARTTEEIRTDSRIESVEQLADIFAKRNRPLLEELRTLLNLLKPEIHPTDEYREIVVSALREGRRGLRDCLDELDQLKLRATACSLPSSLSEKIDALIEEASLIEKSAIQFGLEDDEFVDAEDLEMGDEEA
jgi:hypothetical protein